MAVGVLRPVRGAGGGAAVERRRVVGLDRAEVAAAVVVDRLHAEDREARVVEPVEGGDDRRGRVLVDDEPSDVRGRVEYTVAQPHQPELCDRDGTAGTPGASGHAR